jgi:hypothetical protein
MAVGLLGIGTVLTAPDIQEVASLKGGGHGS